jgi:ribonuclease-3
MRRRSPPSARPGTTSRRSSASPPDRGADSAAASLGALEDLIGLRLSKPELLQQALTHSSWANENPDQGAPDNERLEFLGDAVIHFTVGNALFEQFPDATEGDLTIMRARIVNTGGLADAARRSRLGEFMKLGRGLENAGGREQTRLLANAFEAVVAAIFLDAGLEPAQEYVTRFVEAPSAPSKDAKSSLAILIQARGGPAPGYFLVDTDVESHPIVHTVEVRLGHDVLATATGTNRQTAEQRAAQIALDTLDAWEAMLPVAPTE